jgi:hypothetical protein
MVWTEAGIEIVVSAVQPWNALALMVVTDDGIVTEVRDVQLAKADALIVLILVPLNTMEVIAALSVVEFVLNKFSGILVA